MYRLKKLGAKNCDQTSTNPEKAIIAWQIGDTLKSCEGKLKVISAYRCKLISNTDVIIVNSHLCLDLGGGFNIPTLA